MLTEPARAKVNLFLRVVGRRADGYHLLDSLAVFPALGDLVRAAPSDTLTLRLDGPFGAGLSAEPDNLVLRAARALASAMALPAAAALALEKNLPVSSGIGGGSADAAATLRLLQRLWKTTLDTETLAALALALGADVPVCLAARPARMGGVGEALSDAPGLPRCGMVLINPRHAVATPAVFKARRSGFSEPASLPASWPTAAAMAAGLAPLGNDLEAPAIALCPPIGDVLAWLAATDGCLLARMSGSGATCFGLFADPVQARDVAGTVPVPWWAWGGALDGRLSTEPLTPG